MMKKILCSLVILYGLNLLSSASMPSRTCYKPRDPLLGGANPNAVLVSTIGADAYDFNFYAEFRIDNSCDGQVLVKIASPPILLITEVIYGLLHIERCTQTNPDSSTRVGSTANVMQEAEVEPNWGSPPPSHWPDRVINIFFTLDVYEFSAHAPAQIECTVLYVAVHLQFRLQVEILGCPDGLYGNRCEHTCSCPSGDPCHTFTGDCLSPITPEDATIETTMTPAQPVFRESVTIHCKLLPLGSQNISSQQWLFNGLTTLPSDIIIQEEVSSGQMSTFIEIPRVTDRHEGNFTCVIRLKASGKRFNKTHTLTISACPSGFFGLSCDQTCMCSQREVCQRLEGCVCQQEDCENTRVLAECPDNYYGFTCEERCDCEDGQVCDRMVGCSCPPDDIQCISVDAILLPSDGSKSQMKLAAGLVGAALLVVLIAVCLFLLGRHFNWRPCAWSDDKEFLNKYYLQYAEEKKRKGETIGKEANLPTSLVVGDAPVTPDVVKEPGKEQESLLAVYHVPEHEVFKGQMLGEGAFCRVYDGRILWKYNLPVALKVIKNANNQFAKRDLMSEFETLIDLCPHPNIVQLVGVTTISDSVSGSACFTLALEYMEQGSLLRILKATKERLATIDEPSMPSRTFLKFVTDIAAGMKHMASKKLIHRDLAARNILISADMVAKIGDFGLSRDCYLQDLYRQEPDNNKMLPWFWMAPESMSDYDYTIKSDVWSFGVLLWEICSLGELPYPGLVPQEILGYLEQGKRMSAPVNCPDEWNKIMQQCWSWDPTSRPMFNTLHQEFQNMLSSDRAIPTFLKNVPLVNNHPETSSVVESIDPYLEPGKKATESIDPYLEPGKKATENLYTDPGYLAPGVKHTNRDEGYLSPVEKTTTPKESQLNPGMKEATVDDGYLSPISQDKTSQLHVGSTESIRREDLARESEENSTQSHPDLNNSVQSSSSSGEKEDIAPASNSPTHPNCNDMNTDDLTAKDISQLHHNSHDSACIQINDAIELDNITARKDSGPQNDNSSESTVINIEGTKLPIPIHDPWDSDSSENS